jgi:hypothetical protein
MSRYFSRMHTGKKGLEGSDPSLTVLRVHAQRRALSPRCVIRLLRGMCDSGFSMMGSAFEKLASSWVVQVGNRVGEEGKCLTACDSVSADAPTQNS